MTKKGELSSIPLPDVAVKNIQDSKFDAIQETISLLKKLDYVELDSLSELTFEKFPPYSFFPGSQETLTALFNSSNVVFDRDGILMFQYSVNGKVVLQPVVSAVLEENTYSFYLLEHPEKRVIIFVNDYPVFAVSGSANDRKYTWCPTPLTIEVPLEGRRELFWSFETYRPLKLHNVDISHLLMKETLTELFSKGFVRSGTDIIPASFKILWSAHVEENIWEEMLQIGEAGDYINILERKPLTKKNLIRLIEYVTNDTVARMVVFHEHFDDQLAEHLITTHANELVLRQIAEHTTSPKILEQFIDTKPYPVHIFQHVALNLFLPSCLLKEIIADLPYAVTRSIFLRKNHPVEVFTPLLPASRLHPCYGLIPEIIEEMVSSEAGLIVLEETLISEGIAPEGSKGMFPVEILQTYAMDNFYHNKIKVKRVAKTSEEE